MNNIREILQDYLLFVVLFAIFLVVFVMFLLLFNNSKNKKAIYFYGLLIDLKNTQIFALSCLLINSLFLIYTLVMKIALTKGIIIVSMILVLLAFILCKSIKYVIINGLINVVNLALIYFANLVNSLRLDNDTTTFYVLQIMTNIFGILFYIFTCLKFARNIHRKGELNEKNS